MWAMAAGLRLAPKTKVRLKVEAYYDRGPFGDIDNVAKSVGDGLMLCCPGWDDRDIVELNVIRAKVPFEPFTRITVEVLEEGAG